MVVAALVQRNPLVLLELADIVDLDILHNHPCYLHQILAQEMSPVNYLILVMELMWVLSTSSLHLLLLIELLDQDRFLLCQIDTRRVEYFLCSVFLKYKLHYYLLRFLINRQHLSKSYFW